MPASMPGLEKAVKISVINETNMPILGHMCLTDKALAEKLLAALGWDDAPLLSKEQAERRARAILEEVDDLKFDLKPFPWLNATRSGVVHPYPAYTLDDPRYDLNRIKPGEKGEFAIECPGISCGDLLKFGRACEIKQRHLDRWPREIKNALRDPQQHLDALEEILWLGRFANVQNAKQKVVQSNGKDADWHLTIDGRPVQIEVKNRRGEWTGAIDGSHRNREFASWYGDIIGKFVRADGAGVNIACVTTYYDPDESLWARAMDLLSTEESIDAVAVWATFSRKPGNLSAISNEEISPFLRSAFAPIAREDAMKVLHFKYLMRNSGKRCVVTVQEGIEQVLKAAVDAGERPQC